MSAGHRRPRLWEMQVAPRHVVSFGRLKRPEGAEMMATQVVQMQTACDLPAWLKRPCPCSGLHEKTAGAKEENRQSGLRRVLHVDYEPSSQGDP